MAFIAITLPVCAPALTSCETDEPDTVPNTLTLREAAYPDNPANQYDAAGQLYNALTESYIYGGLAAGTAAEAVSITEAIAAANPDFMRIKPAGYVTPAAARIDYIATHEQAAAHEIISTAGLSVKAQLSLSGFIDTLMDYDALTDYGIIYTYIINYETAVLTDPMLTGYDQRVMLTTSSIARHGFYLRKKKRPRDRDWDISWGNITAGTEGGTEDTAKAAVMAVATGILLNK